MSSNGFPKTPSVFVARPETIINARRYCARQVTEGRLPRTELRTVLLALGLDETAQFSEDVRVQDIPITYKWI